MSKVVVQSGRNSMELSGDFSRQTEAAIRLVGGEVFQRMDRLMDDVFERARARWPAPSPSRSPTSSPHQRAKERTERHPYSTGASIGDLDRFIRLRDEGTVVEVVIRNRSPHAARITTPAGRIPGAGVSRSGRTHVWTELVRRPGEKAIADLTRDLARVLEAKAQKALDGEG